MKPQMIALRPMFVQSGVGANGLRSMVKRVQVKAPMLLEQADLVNVLQVQIVLLEFLIAPNLDIAMEAGYPLMRHN